MTLLYALSTGGHYLVDLIVAVPLTVAVLLRFGTGVLLAGLAIPYGLTLATLLFCAFTSRARATQPAGHQRGMFRVPATPVPTLERTSAASAPMNAGESLSPGTIR